LERLDRQAQRRRRPLVPVVAALEIALVGLEVVGRPAHGVPGAAEQRRRQRADERGYDLILDLEDVGHLAVVLLGPELKAGIRVDQRGADPQPGAGAADAALDDGAD